MLDILRPTKKEIMIIKKQAKKIKSPKSDFSIIKAGKQFLLVETHSEGRPNKKKFLLGRSPNPKNLVRVRAGLLQKLKFHA
jgi:hypothetical protein